MFMNPSHEPGKPLAMFEAISFDVPSTPGAMPFVFASFEDKSLLEDGGAFGSTEETVHDGATFGGMYRGTDNARIEIDGGYRYHVLRNGGWPAAVTFTVKEFWMP